MRRGWAVVVIAFVVIAAAVAALQLPARRVAAGSKSAEASRVLERVARSDRVPYRALQMVAYYGEPQSNALLDVRSSRRGRYVRATSGGEVTRLWSRADVGVVASADSALREVAPAVVEVEPKDVLTKYDVEVGEPDEMLGTTLVPLRFVRGADEAVAERWWVHEKSGVVYRRDVYGKDGAIVGMSTVIEMEWGDPGPAEHVARDVDEVTTVEGAAARGVPERLVGGYALWRTYELAIDGRDAKQWVYSDGLHALSVFSTAGGMKAPRGFERSIVGGSAVWTGPGPGTWAWEGAGKSWLVVAEEPSMDAASLIAPFPKGGPSLWARLGSVWSRIANGIGDLFS
jgi:hypothetical protein